MAEGVSGENPSLIIDVGGRACALPLSCVMETMRPLPVEAVAGTPPFVRGVAMVRGVPTPVLDLAVLLGADRGIAGRFVILRLGERQVAISVEAVLGVRMLAATTQQLPPLLHGAAHEAIHAIGTLDRHLLVVLRAGWQLPGEVWKALSAGAGWQ
jgi:purine-binding chemotaxis protein CheW